MDKKIFKDILFEILNECPHIYLTDIRTIEKEDSIILTFDGKTFRVKISDYKKSCDD